MSNPIKNKNSRPSDENKNRSSKLSGNRHSRTLSGENNKSGGRLSIPFLIEEERTLPLQKDKKVEAANDVDEPEIAENIIPDKIFDEARSSIVLPPE